MNRRRFFTALGGMALSSVTSWAEEVAPKIDLDLVRREYVRMYEHLRHEQEIAAKAGKDFIIVSGGVLNSSNSAVLLEAMLSNILWRLGVSNCAYQYPPSKEIDICNELTVNLAALYHTKGKEYLQELNMQLLSALQAGNYIGEFPEEHDRDLDPQNIRRINLDLLAAYSFIFSGTDTLAYRPPKDVKLADFKDIFINTDCFQREAEMIKEISKVKGDRLCTCEARHLDAVVKGLSANKNNHVVGMNFSCGVDALTPKQRQVMERYDPSVVEFFDGRNKATAEYYTPKIPLSPQLQAGEAMAMMFLAYHAHEKQIPARRKEYLLDRIKEIVPEIPGLTAAGRG